MVQCICLVDSIVDFFTSSPQVCLLQKKSFPTSLIPSKVHGSHIVKGVVLTDFLIFIDILSGFDALKEASCGCVVDTILKDIEDLTSGIFTKAWYAIVLSRPVEEGQA